MTRKRPSKPSLSMQLEALFKRFQILCVVCAERLEWDDDREWHHLIEHADGGEHCTENLGPAHPKPCHKKVSAKAETQRSRIDRLETVRTQAEDLERGELIYTSFAAAKPKYKWASRPFQKRQSSKASAASRSETR